MSKPTLRCASPTCADLRADEVPMPSDGLFVEVRPWLAERQAPTTDDPKLICLRCGTVYAFVREHWVAAFRM